MRLLVGCIALLLSASACAAQTPNDLETRLEQGITAYDAGRRDEAYRIFDSFIDAYNNAGGRLSARELVAVGTALRYLGERDPQLYKDALKALDEAAAADPRSVHARVAAGELFLDKYNAGEARRSFEAALRIDSLNADALAGMARVLDFDGRTGSLALARRALQRQPQHRGALFFLAQQFAEADQPDSAMFQVVALKGAHPGSIEAVIAEAIVSQLAGDRQNIARLQNSLAGNSTSLAKFDVALAELSVQQRQYADAVQQARSAISADSLSWRAWSVLGVNQLRLGDVTTARTSLERAFRGDPYNVWVKNTLDLLDRMDSFETRAVGNFVFVASKRDADVVLPYAQEIGEEAVAKLSKRYGYTPPLPIRVEFFDRHADFSVRTVGLAGLGALGVSFGSVLAVDAPSAREPGAFNWASTLWHETAHAFHLGMTAHRVPRWFTEGLATLEERRARPGWGEEGLAPFIAAAREKKLLPLKDLNSGFVRPNYPTQVFVSYYQASLLLELIEERFGEKALRAMLEAYRDGHSTERALKAATGWSLEQADEAFAGFVDRRVADTSRRALAEGAANYSVLSQSDQPGMLESALYIWPYDTSLHAKLAARYQTSDPKRAVRERQVIVALQPVDMAEARYQLALAHRRAGDSAAARKEVLRALEIAPNFENAQTLLLQLSEASK